jgi:hypothetical protein
MAWLNSAPRQKLAQFRIAGFQHSEKPYVPQRRLGCVDRLFQQLALVVAGSLLRKAFCRKAAIVPLRMVTPANSARSTSSGKTSPGRLAWTGMAGLTALAPGTG